MLSVIDALKETPFLWVRYFWFLVALNIATELPQITFNLFSITHPLPRHHASPVFLGITLLGVAGLPILNAMNSASILGFLKNPTWGKTSRLLVWKSVCDYTWPLMCLFFLLGGIGVLVAIPFLLVARLLGHIDVMVILMQVSFLIFAKYALADPLIVYENMGARAALRRSWEMTRGHFGYVGSCYLILGGGFLLATKALSSPLNNHESFAQPLYLFIHFCFAMADSSWVLLSWCMYQRIKALEPQFLIATAPTNQSPPESPCGP